MKAMVFSLFVLFVMAFGPAGCGGGGAKLQSESYSTTLGQELKDLEDAYKKGIITEKQYEESKKKLIEQRTGK
jgi:hypothetical protein